MKEGCLSHIRPGCGTNRNERLRKLKKIAGRSKLGDGLAYAFFTRAFHSINEEIKEQTLNVKEIETRLKKGQQAAFKPLHRVPVRLMKISLIVLYVKL